MTELNLEIGGMSCGHCVAGVSRALQALDGVNVEQVEVGKASIRYDAARVSPAQVEQAIADEGYTVVASR